jgi:hypothetical protein
LSRASVRLALTLAVRTVPLAVCQTMVSVSPDWPGKAWARRAVALADSVPETS